MYLYNLTLQRATGITHAIHGNFSGDKTQEILVSRGKCLEMLRPDPTTGKVHTLLTVEIFGIVRSLMAFRLTGGTQDYIIVGSDSGRIVILKYDGAKNVLEKVHQRLSARAVAVALCPASTWPSTPRAVPS
ncbi:splicing factor 3B subunit 3-like [Nilaparvata lugens]|uniref:splicing factor 3B subunit 3-like n=1 Tax=Nilaparvata lugens TaxID=108931 RepID=UPI00193DF22C|nr:splicing factor 3B subunit 3-like [Nilaparvata lugens]